MPTMSYLTTYTNQYKLSQLLVFSSQFSDSSLSSVHQKTSCLQEDPRLGQMLTTSLEDYNPKDNFSVAVKLLE